MERNFMLLFRFALITILTLLCMSCKTAAQSDRGNVVVEEITHRKWNNCFRIRNSTTEVIVSPTAGGRVLLYALNGKNVMYENRAFDGSTLSDFREKRALWPDGGRFDFGPSTIPGTERDEPFMGIWKATIINNSELLLEFDTKNMLGISLTRKFVLDQKTSKLTIEQTLKNQTNKPIKRHFWNRTFCKGGGKLIMPIEKNEWGVMIPEKTEINPELIQIDADKLTYIVSDTTKIGSKSRKGWIKYIVDDIEIVQRFPCFSNADYSATEGYTTIFYSNGQVCELEPVSDLVEVESGESHSFWQEWELFDSVYNVYNN